LLFPSVSLQVFTFQLTPISSVKDHRFNLSNTHHHKWQSSAFTADLTSVSGQRGM
jgi:hypothetical protein